MLNRRGVLCAAPFVLAAPGLARSAGSGPLGDLKERTFRFFWETTNPRNGLAPDRWPTPSFSSIAATGFALTAYPVGVVNGWITRAEARTQTLTTLRFLLSLPQGDAKAGVAGYKGFFYHFLDIRTGLRFRTNELSTIDTALLLGGVLFAGEWFDGAHPDEREIRDLAQRIYARVDWRWFQDQLDTGDARLSMGWHPESGFIARRWNGYTEAMLLYVLALGSATYGIGPEAWTQYCATYDENWRGTGSTRHLAGAPMFWHQYSHVWIDLRGIRDEAMRAAGFDYFENSRRAAYAQQAYAIADPGDWRGYGRDVWGLTACDGPGDFTATIDRRERTFFGYSARGPVDQPDGRDDGTLSPTAALGSIAFAPEIAEPVAYALRRRYGAALYGRYGFLDSFNPTLVRAYPGIAKGRVVRGLGWFDTDYLGIDQGPIVAMMENRDTGLVWNAMRSAAPIRRGLERADFTGGWLGTGSSNNGVDPPRKTDQVARLAARRGPMAEW